MVGCGGSRSLFLYLHSGVDRCIVWVLGLGGVVIWFRGQWTWEDVVFTSVCVV